MIISKHLDLVSKLLLTITASKCYMFMNSNQCILLLYLKFLPFWFEIVAIEP